MPPLDPALAARLYARSQAARWNVAVERFAAALQAALTKTCEGAQPSPADIERHLTALHLEDLALACACADGDEAAWEHFVLQHRPVLYRAADALAPGGGAREVADAIYADLFGTGERDGQRRSLFGYFHGRSSLATWLRAVLAQRYVDRIRQDRRLEPLDDDDVRLSASAPAAPDPDRDRYLALIGTALARAVEALASRDRLRLSLYYAQQLTLAEAGRILNEHEATVSRHLARTRTALRAAIDADLRAAGLAGDEIPRCYQAAIEDAGPLDVASLFDGTAEPRKKDGRERSKG